MVPVALQELQQVLAEFLALQVLVVQTAPLVPQLLLQEPQALVELQEFLVLMAHLVLQALQPELVAHLKLQA